MPVPKYRQFGVVPKYLSVGAVFVVEGRVNVDGDLRISSRYLIVPGGGRIDLPSRSAWVRRGSRNSLPPTGSAAEPGRRIPPARQKNLLW